VNFPEDVQGILRASLGNVATFFDQSSLSCQSREQRMSGWGRGHLVPPRAVSEDGLCELQFSVLC
jgi:hypothetical protein